MSNNEELNEYQPYAAGLPVEDEPQAQPEVTPEPVAEVLSEEPVVTETPAVEDEPKPKAAKPKAEEVPSEPHVIGSGDTDQVFLAQCVYKNMYARKSLSVHHLQRRLAELGYGDASADRDGWYGDLTKASVESFQKDNGLDGEGLMDATTLTRIFAGDKNVTLVLPE